MKLSHQARRRLAAAFSAAAVLCAVLIPVALATKLNFSPRLGWNFTLEHAALRFTYFDPYLWGPMYHKGFTAETPHYAVRWLPSVHWSRDVGGQFVVDMPLWVPTVLFAALAMLGRRRGWHLMPWQCLCGYDVRGIAAGRCPECGRPC